MAKNPGLLEYPITWRARLANTSDIANPPIFWHFVRGPQLQGHAYFVGYDSVSKRVAGFIGRQGFSASLPPEEEWFDVGLGFFNGNPSIYASRIGMDWARSYNTWRYQAASDFHCPPDWVGFLVNDDQLLKINLCQRTVSVFSDSRGASSVKFGAESRAPSTRDGEVKTTPKEVAKADAAYENRPKTVPRFLVRYPDRVVVRDLKNQTSQEFFLPVSLLDTSVDTYLHGNGQLLVKYHDGYWESGPRYLLI